MADRVTPPDYKTYDVWYTPDYLPPPPITAAELAERLGPGGQHGQFLIREYIKWIENKVPVDRYGYRAIYDEKVLKGWRSYQVDQLIHSLGVIEKIAKQMNDKQSFLGENDDRLQDRTR